MGLARLVEGGGGAAAAKGTKYTKYFNGHQSLSSWSVLITEAGLVVRFVNEDLCSAHR